MKLVAAVLVVLLAACGSSASSGRPRTPSQTRDVYSTVQHVEVDGQNLTYICFITSSGVGGRNTNAPWCDRVTQP